MMQNAKNAFKVYAISIGISLGVGLLSAFLTRGNMTVYEELQTPPLSPPAFLFPLVWTVLYVLMGVSAALVWQNRQKSPLCADRGIAFYAVSLVFNFLWSILFFNFRLFGFSFLWLLGLLYLIIRTILAYLPPSRLAAYLQIPYVLWVFFAGYLNFGIWLLNG